MRTPAQQTASRANGARSRGPKTQEGKLRSTTKPFLHDQLAKATVVKKESREGFQELVRQFMLRIAPRDPVEQAAVEEICSATWRLYRLRAIERKAINLELAAQSSPDDLECLLHACGALAGTESRLPSPPPASGNPPPDHHPARPRPHRGPASPWTTKQIRENRPRRTALGPGVIRSEALIHAPPATHPRPPGCSLRHPRKNPGRTQEEPKKNPGRTRQDPEPSPRGHSRPTSRKPSLHPRTLACPHEFLTHLHPQPPQIGGLPSPHPARHPRRPRRDLPGSQRNLQSGLPSPDPARHPRRPRRDLPGSQRNLQSGLPSPDEPGSLAALDEVFQEASEVYKGWLMECKLLDTLIRLRDLGITVLVVEHDTETILCTDCMLGLEPGAGSAPPKGPP